MKIPYQNPDPAGTERSHEAKEFRDLSTEVARTRPHAATLNNGEETDHEAPYPANFTKGLCHDGNGLLQFAEDYRCFVEAINSRDRTLFEKQVATAESRKGDDTFSCKAADEKTEWRGWESPRAGHVFELEGPDAGAVGMAPAPRVGSSELAAEMAEVYAMALLRDVSFTDISKGTVKKKLCAEGGTAPLTGNQIAKLLSGMSFYSGKDVVSSTPCQTDKSGLNGFERRRREARTLEGDLTAPITAAKLFRGSTLGSQVGPYISQFMLAGVNSRGGGVGGTPSYPALSAKFDAEDGYIIYGTQIIDQRVVTHRGCFDHMTDWASWLDVQNGANFGGADVYEEKRRFITTPRDLATYVHFDALYQAYLNAALIMLSLETPGSKGFAEPSATGKRTPFATFGGPHILSLVTEVATRCLKAVRRQKFNYHRRARPEAIGGRLVLAAAGKSSPLGNAATAFEATVNEIPNELLKTIIEHNGLQNNASRTIKCNGTSSPDAMTAATFKKNNVLLPMAFPEGSPMHPAYGAGHATVAGGCVTMLKAFFEMFDPSRSDGKRVLKIGDKDYFEPDATGTKLVNKSGIELTVQGELDKLAANIAIGRNMAGVHYYSDYYDSLRMGERIAVGILMEQAPTYGDEVEMQFDSFDGDRIVISGEAGSCPTLIVTDDSGQRIPTDEWWLRHSSGEEIILDL